MDLLINDLLYAVVEQKASDLHISTGMPVMMRLDGDIKPLPLSSLKHKNILSDNLSNEMAESLIFELLDDEQKKAFKQNIELDFAYTHSDKMRFRVSVFKQNHGISAVLRLINHQILTSQQIGLQQAIKKISTLKKGLVLVTGSSGSGKSTTLASIIDYINQTRQAHIITIEDPIEFIHKPKQCLVSQREVKRHTQGFKNALRAALRADPDVILIGELRDTQTIRLAITAAETGHLVLATLHTNSATKTINRMIDAFDTHEKATISAMLADSLQAVVSQTLIKQKNGGRVAAFEVMFANPAICNLIRHNKTAQMYSAIQTGASDGMITMEKSLQNLMATGEILAEASQYHSNIH
ncbi:type IV pilus twitching motility protein PilT [Psychrobacter sp. HD31]|uniref:type IV pilus twitching motility protein PilT n=1 Tax=Psychrobacter sp. HD31 TaxID=3112003 RepID=UPI003DA56841